MTLPRFFARSIDPAARTAELAADEGHHLVRVLRLPPGAEIIVFDGRGGDWLARVERVDRGGVTVALARPLEAVAEPAVAVTLAVGLLKGDEMDVVVRDAAMLGAARLVPLETAYVARSKRARTDAALERWRRVALASVKQCRRAVVPAIDPVTPLDDLLARSGDGLLVGLVEPALGGAMPIGSLGPAPGAARVLIGPEGGWAREEVDRMREAGAALIQLGPRTLRAASAPAVVLSALWTQWRVW